MTPGGGTLYFSSLPQCCPAAAAESQSIDDIRCCWPVKQATVTYLHGLLRYVTVRFRPSLAPSGESSFLLSPLSDDVIQRHVTKKVTKTYRRWTVPDLNNCCIGSA